MLSCTRLNNILKERFDIDLMYCMDRDHIESVYQHYASRLQGRSLNESQQCGRDFLIMETARMILREIAPLRRKKKKKGS